MIELVLKDGKLLYIRPSDVLAIVQKDAGNTILYGREDVSWEVGTSVTNVRSSLGF
jgi:hypothetical protein